jgi:hypothetical protein
MATVLESLKSISGYPVPQRTFVDIATKRNLMLDDEATQDVLNSTAYRLAKADILRWVSFAPNVSQGDISFDLPDSDREQLRARANAVYGALGDAEYIPEAKAKFGYRGDRL